MLRRDCDHLRQGRRAPCLPATLAVAFALCLAPAGPVSGQGPGAAPSFRLFLTDGTPIVSFGEFARANGRVVFTVPIGSPASPDKLQVVSLPDTAIDWDRTSRYAEAVRYRFYASTRGEQDFAALTGAVARALGDIAFAADASAKLAVAADIRRQLLEWPAAHFAYRSADVRELTAHVEEAISDIRAGSGLRTFDLSLVAMIEPPSDALLPEPQLKDALDSVATVARVTDIRRDRLTLQESIVEVLDRRRRTLPKEWRSATRKSLVRSLEREKELDRRYAELTARTLRDARKGEAKGDVAALERLAAGAQEDDARLGYQRPEAMQALLASLALSTVKARERRQAIDLYERRKSDYGSYERRVGDCLEDLDGVADEIGAVKASAGLKGRRLSNAEKRVSAVEAGLLLIRPPADLEAVHGLLVSSARLMREALRLHRGAAAAAESAAAGNASAAAAGALLLLDAGRARIEAFFRRPAAP